ncbi:hypothetical protein BP5796_04190 [Coleophoma crateriformis]|uniref:Peptidase A1 domain-containing protein n=1 Tax=Coleophoma crateriformis TaxID=565419 RepID=A0A3D8SHP0_9HELO|nr:hypothetical protein BP5796_04190 [Coleophoma crateriformis]
MFSTVPPAVLVFSSLLSFVAASKLDFFHTHRHKFNNTKISIPQTPNPNFNATLGTYGPAAYAFAMAKYGVNVDTPLAVSVNARDTVVANPAYSYYDKEYLCAVKIGTPPQTLPLDFDTGSADLWVFSSETPSSYVSTGKAIYTPSKSSTAKLVTGSTWALTYGDGSSSSGDVYTDNVTIGSLKVAAQAVEAAQKVSSQFAADTALSGLLGLAFGTANQAKPRVKTFFDNIRPALPLPIFTVNLKKGAPGSFNFGYIDSTQYTGAITYTPVTPRYSLWEFGVSGFSIGQGAKNSTIIDAVADTGTSLLLLPISIVKAYYAQIAGSSYSTNYGAYVYPCSITPPDFNFYIGSAKQTVPGRYMNYGYISNTQCYGGIQSQGTLMFSLFGDIALKAQFVVFDASVPRIGWANKPTL